MKRDRDWGKLLNEVAELCRVYVGKNAPSEQWIETCRRLEMLDKLVKKIRRQQAIEDRARSAPATTNAASRN